MTDDFISRLEALGREATEGPWRWSEPFGVLMGPGPTEKLDAAGVGTTVLVLSSNQMAWPLELDARFIATARNCWDELVAVAAAAKSQLDANRHVMQGWSKQTADELFAADRVLSGRIAALAQYREVQG